MSGWFRADASLIRLALVAVLAAWLSGCSAGGPTLQSANLSAERVDASGNGTPATVQYVLARPASVTLELLGANNQRYLLRQDEPRPAGTYQYLLDGTYPLPDDPEQRRTLADGDYRLVVRARGADGEQQQEFPLRVEHADPLAPPIENLALYPPTISPNFDGLDDVARGTYRLEKRARVYAYVLTPDGGHLPLGARELRQPGEYAVQWDGTREDAPVADGAYQLVVQASDDAGNVSVARAPLAVQTGGQPDARVVRVEFSPRQIMVGGEVQVAITVKNNGPTVLRTQGPEPGFVYDSYDTFASISDHQFVDRAGTWRVGVDWAGSPAAAASKYAYRWGFGHDLQPGEEVTVQGAIRVLHGPTQDSGRGPRQNRIFFYAGLIHEGFDFQEDKIGGTWVEIGY